ncbi:MAG: hypothetical protein FWG84_04055 [Bacteroidales bacterium]|nr:hypothetical protein [Bacteroidales bacterium]
MNDFTNNEAEVSDKDFIENLQQKLKKPLEPKAVEDVGYLLGNTHFKIGSKVHSEHFYYAKRLFQNNKDTSKLAEIIANKIFEKKSIKPMQKVTLIGYEMYSELLLSLVKNSLKEKMKNAITHFIAQDEQGVLKFKSKKIFEEFVKDDYGSMIIIIVPIASTGSTAVKIVETIRNEIIKFEKEKNNNLDKAEKDYKDKIEYFPISYNVLWAKPIIDNCESEEEKREQQKMLDKYLEENIETNTEKRKKIEQEAIIDLHAKWHQLKDCPLCDGIDKNGNEVETKPLYETDKSSLTPAIIFGFPRGKKTSQIQDFNEITFKDTLNYKNTYRNNEFKLYSIDTEKFIDKNEPKIKGWLQQTVKTKLLSVSTEKVTILAPCHESNSRFINMVNEFVFDSKATIIHHQPEIDFADNFNLLYKQYFQDNSKIFYVDDSIITGKHYFQLYDLARNAILTSNKENIDKKAKAKAKAKARKPFEACIVLKDKTPPDIHNRIKRWSGKHFVFVNINLPPNFSLSDNQPLLHELKRYEFLSQEFALHDSLIKTFNDKAKKLDSKREKIENNTHEKRKENHLLQFEAMHKIYEYFAETSNIGDIEKLVTFKQEDKENAKALLKVLSQYPFILYQPLKEKIFKYHRDLFKKIIDDGEDFDYNKFLDFKFHTRRAVLLNDYQILGASFGEKVKTIFDFIKNYRGDTEERKGDTEERKDVEEFPIFLVRNYLELIQKNGWVAVKLKKFLDGFGTPQNAYAKQFYRMLRIESATIIDDFMKMIVKEHRTAWRDMYKDKDSLETGTEQISKFFLKYKDIPNTNKYEMVKSLLDLSDWYGKGKEVTPFENYLWIKQLLYADCIDDKFLQKTPPQDKIKAIVEKMKGFFPQSQEVQAFFVVTDRKNQPYSLYQDGYVLNGFEDNYSQTSNAFSHLFAFLNGQDDKQNIAKITIAEYTKESGKPWKDLYNKHDNAEVEIKYLPNSMTWLLLIRISQFEEEKFKTLGVLGFYSDKGLPEDTLENLLPKQLLMLLRRDMGKFINKHHKNDEFAALRLAQQVKRFAYLAGHGRQVMQQLAHIENGELFGDIVSTMEKLQYISAVKLIDNKGNTEKIKNKTEEELLQDSFYGNYPTYQDLKAKINKMAAKIYESPIIENEVNFEQCGFTENNIRNCDTIRINKEILEMICFELIINAKKNRWCEENEKKNAYTLSFSFEQNNGYILIKATSIGAEMYKNTCEKINNGVPIKPDYEVSGLDLISNVAKKLYQGDLKVNSKKKDGTEKYENTVIVKLKLN